MAFTAADRLRRGPLSSQVDSYLLRDGGVLRGVAVGVEDTHSPRHVPTLRRPAHALAVPEAESVAAARCSAERDRELLAAVSGEAVVADARAKE